MFLVLCLCLIGQSSRVESLHPVDDFVGPVSCTGSTNSLGAICVATKQRTEGVSIGTHVARGTRARE
jgi:hypothetical protein